MTTTLNHLFIDIVHPKWLTLDNVLTGRYSYIGGRINGAIYSSSLGVL